MKPSKRIATLVGAGLMLWSCGSKDKKVAAPAPQITANQSELDARGAEFSSIPKALIVHMERDPITGLEKAETAKLIQLDYVPTGAQIADNKTLLASGQVVDAASINSTLDDSFDGAEGSVETGAKWRSLKWFLSPKSFKLGFATGLVSAGYGRTPGEIYTNGLGGPLISGQQEFINVPFIPVGQSQSPAYLGSRPCYTSPETNLNYDYGIQGVRSYETSSTYIYSAQNSKYYESGLNNMMVGQPYAHIQGGNFNACQPAGGPPMQGACGTMPSPYSVDQTGGWNTQSPYGDNVY